MKGTLCAAFFSTYAYVSFLLFLFPPNLGRVFSPGASGDEAGHKLDLRQPQKRHGFKAAAYRYKKGSLAFFLERELQISDN